MQYGSAVIDVHNITKRFGSTVAVDDLSFRAEPGRVTGFLGPNGSGKSTTMRCMLGLDRPNSGSATFGGVPYHSIVNPLFQVGALLDAGYVHPARTGRDHLRWMAMSNGIDAARIGETLDLVGLTDAAGRRVKGYSLGMRQRLGLAGVMLGDPGIIMLDEPANGLDPEGIRWIRDILTFLAREGRTILVSSHLLSEIALMADDLVVIGRGALIEQGSVESFVDRHSTRWVRVASPQLDALLSVIGPSGTEVTRLDDRRADLRGIDAARVGEIAAQERIVLHELSTQVESLEEAFLRATAGAQEFASNSPRRPPIPGTPLPPPPSPPFPPSSPPPSTDGAS